MILCVHHWCACMSVIHVHLFKPPSVCACQPCSGKLAVGPYCSHPACHLGRHIFVSLPCPGNATKHVPLVELSCQAHHLQANSLWCQCTFSPVALASVAASLQLAHTCACVGPCCTLASMCLQIWRPSPFASAPTDLHCICGCGGLTCLGQPPTSVAFALCQGLRRIPVRAGAGRGGGQIMVSGNSTAWSHRLIARLHWHIHFHCSPYCIAGA